MRREKVGVVGEFQMVAIVDTDSDTVAAYEIRDGSGSVNGTFGPSQKADAFHLLRRLVSADKHRLASEDGCSVCAQAIQGETTYVVRIGRKVFSYKSREQAMRFFYQEVARRQGQLAACSAPTA